MSRKESAAVSQPGETTRGITDDSSDGEGPSNTPATILYTTKSGTPRLPTWGELLGEAITTIGNPVRPIDVIEWLQEYRPKLWQGKDEVKTKAVIRGALKQEAKKPNPKFRGWHEGEDWMYGPLLAGDTAEASRPSAQSVAQTVATDSSSAEANSESGKDSASLSLMSSADQLRKAEKEQKDQIDELVRRKATLLEVDVEAKRLSDLAQDERAKADAAREKATEACRLAGDAMEEARIAQAEVDAISRGIEVASAEYDRVKVAVASADAEIERLVLAQDAAMERMVID